MTRTLSNLSRRSPANREQSLFAARVQDTFAVRGQGDSCSTDGIVAVRWTDSGLIYREKRPMH